MAKIDINVENYKDMTGLKKKLFQIFKAITTRLNDFVTQKDINTALENYQIPDGSVETDKLADGSVTLPKIAPRKFQEKILGSDFTSDGIISAISFNGLIIGKSYKVSGHIRLDIEADGASYVQILSGTTRIGVAGSGNRNSSNTINWVPFAFDFVATGTSLDFEAVSLTASTYIDGDGTKLGTFTQLQEIPDLIATTDWT